MKSLLHKLSYVTRASDWRLSFVPFIMGTVYVYLGWFQIPFTSQTVWLTFLSLVTTVGFSSLGYFINEYFDKASDAKAGKLNKLAYMPSSAQFGIFIGSLLLTFFPWIWLPSTFFSWCLITTQVSLFLMYSLPFSRFKEHTYLSLIIDASYAYVVPLWLSFYTFSLIAGQPGSPLWFHLFSAAVFFVGIRNIVVHQIKDVFRDARLGLNFLPLRLGVNATRVALHTLLVYECFFMFLFMVAFVYEKPPFIILFFFCAVGFMLQVNSIFVAKSENWREGFFANRIYQYAFPLGALTLLSTTDLKWLIIVVPLHLLLLFPPSYVSAASDFTCYVFHKLKSALVHVVVTYFRHLLSMAINYPIYLFFKLIGIDLIKENKTAADVLFGRKKK
ncbi:MAG: UbiA family prenyltransferase [Chitinophagales bacterium]|nr:UbiA family prenyltransferase [Chitinophagales bacterium]